MYVEFDKVVEYEIISTKKGGVHGFWWVFWLIMFIPVLILVALVHFSSETTYTVVVKVTTGEVVTLRDVSEYELGQIKAGCFG